MAVRGAVEAGCRGIEVVNAESPHQASAYILARQITSAPADCQ